MAEMPTGAVTFLFTDIESSTRLVKQLRESYRDVLDEHQRLLREAFAAHGGYEVDTQGDSFFVAFGNARDAVLAAVEGQRALVAHPWPEGAAIRVRMGVHTGQAQARDGRYTGLAVHRAARIGAAGHGGQVLVSQATQTLLEDEEDDLHVAFRDLGEQRLKDLDRPVRLFQAVADGLPTSFPPPRGREEGGGRKWVLAAVAAVVVVLVAAVAAVALRSGGVGLGGIQRDHVGLIDTRTNEIAAEIPVGIRPGPVAVGAGAVWVGNLDDRTLTKIAASTRAVSGTFPLDGRTPTGIAVGLGAVWVAHGARGQVSLVEPQFGDVVRSVSVAGTAFGSENGSVALDGESAWAAFGDSTLVHLDADGSPLGQTLAGTQPAGVVEADGSIWVTSSGDATVLRFNAQTFGEGPTRIFSVPSQPVGIVHAEESIWVASAGDGVVTRIDPSSGGIVQISVFEGVETLAAGAGSVWAASPTAATVARIDPATNTVVARIEVGSAPAGLAVDGDFVWVAAQAP